MKKVKANSQEKKFYRLLLKAKGILESLLNEQYHERHAGSFISFDCKVHKGPDVEQVPTIARELNLSKAQYRAVLEEFESDDKMDNLYHHKLDIVADNFDQYANGFDFESPEYIRDLIKKVLSTKDKSEIGYPGLRDKLKRAKSEKSITKIIHQFFSPSLKYGPYSGFFSDQELFRGGRSGGHFCIAKSDEFIETLDKVNSALKSNFFSEEESEIYINANDLVENRADFLSEFMWLHEVNQSDLESTVGFAEFIEHLLEEGRKIVKKLNTSSFWYEALSEEIIEFVSDISFEVTPEMEAKFMAGELNFSTNYNMNSYLRLAKDNQSIETSMQVRIPLHDGLELFNALQKFVAGDISTLPSMVSNFKITSFEMQDDDWKLKIGCHTFSFKHIERFVNSLGQLV